MTYGVIAAKYDTSILKLVDVGRGTLMGADGIDFKRDVSSGQISINRLAGSPGVDGSGSIVTLTFMAVSKGSAKVTLEDVALENSKREPIVSEKPETTVTIQ